MDVKELIQHLAGTYNLDKIKISDFNVDSVDENTLMCICTPINGLNNAEGLNVRMLPEVCDGVLSIPAVGSTVTVIYGDVLEPIIVAYGEISMHRIIVGDTEVTLTDGDLLIEQGKMSIELKNGKVSIKNDKKNLLDILNNILTHVLALTVPTPSGTSGTPLNYTQFQQDQNDLKNLMQ